MEVYNKYAEALELARNASDMLHNMPQDEARAILAQFVLRLGVYLREKEENKLKRDLTLEESSKFQFPHNRSAVKVIEPYFMAKNMGVNMMCTRIASLGAEYIAKFERELEQHLGNAAVSNHK